MNPSSPTCPRFQKIVQFTLSWEIVRNSRGEVITTRHPADPGGATKYGIDQRSHPTITIDQLTQPQAIAIYYQTYWIRPGFHQLPYPIAEVAFDMGVLQGSATLLRMLQRLVGVKSDGILGPITLQAVQQKSPHPLAKALLLQARMRLQSLPQAQPKLAVFLRGWLRRNHALQRFLDLT